jgi:hypothetical protein
LFGSTHYNSILQWFWNQSNWKYIVTSPTKNTTTFCIKI